MTGTITPPGGLEGQSLGRPGLAKETMQARRDAHAAPSRSANVERVALLSVHTCPLDQPGTGDAGGLNVAVMSTARWLADMGVGVDIFTRWSGRGERITSPMPGVRIVHLDAGPAEPVPKGDLEKHLCSFLYSLLRFEAGEAERLSVDSPVYAVVHAHYWLSGWVARLAAERWGVPFVQSFHTLGRVKNATLAPGDTPEPAPRLAAEERIVQSADRLVAPTPTEASELARFYDAMPDRIRVVSPGVDTERFTPAPDGAAARAREALGIRARSLILFVGRLQPLKSPDTAVRALADLVERCPELDPALLIVGGPSGDGGFTHDVLHELAASLGVGERLFLRDPMPHEDLPDLYRGADVVLVPSRTESFGLVALEASACGVPVVASDVGGLRTVVRDGVTGMLVPVHESRAFAAALEHVLADPATAAALGSAGAHFARRFDWRQSASGLLSMYEESLRDTRSIAVSDDDAMSTPIGHG